MSDKTFMPENPDTRIEELRKRKAKREEERIAALKARELEELELEDRYSEKLGVRGVDFDIVNTAVAVIVLRKPDFIVAKKFNSVPAEKRGEEEVITFVSPCVVEPETMAFRAVIQAHGGVAWRCAAALLAMYGAEQGDKASKF